MTDDAHAYQVWVCSHCEIPAVEVGNHIICETCGRIFDDRGRLTNEELQAANPPTHQQKEQNKMFDIDTDSDGSYEIVINYIDGTNETITATNHQRDGLAVQIMTNAGEEVLLSLTSVKTLTI